MRSLARPPGSESNRVAHPPWCCYGEAVVELIILIGLPASGKSTFHRDRFGATHVLVSKDLFPRSARRPGRRQERLIEEALTAGRSVVVDNTNPTLGDRADLIGRAHAHGARVTGYWFETDVPDCLARNARREGRAKVPVVAIYAARKRLVIPSAAEGFDALYRVRLDTPNGFVVTPTH
jgi:predicted kinase